MLTSFNIAKGIVGEGILSLPNGLAAGTGMISGVLIMIAFYTAPRLPAPSVIARE